MNSDTLINIAITILQNFAYQLVFTIGLIAAIGLIVGLTNKAFFKLVGYKFGRTACMVTGFVGVPVHEIGHALFCIIFRHRIIEIKLYQPNSADGTLGYVRHAYNRKSIYHQIGNFFIGFGPILFGSAMLLLLMYWLVPNLFEAFKNSSEFSEVLNLDVFSLSALKYIYNVMQGASITFYSSSDFSDWRWWIFMVPACSIALHMSLSVADMKSSWMGFGFIVITLLIVNTVLYFIDIDTMLTLTNYCLTAGTFILNFLTISVVFSLILLLFGIIVRVIRR
ncbi:MAG: hypothetical protein LBC85_10075 [Fibromonadaceae bacterium]|jgi:hypothetical protein|nr:hypothetical protein [Fibromonadaceae bacterium]